MNNLLSNNFSTSIPLASAIASILYLINGNMGLYILSVVCLIMPAVVFFCIAVYLFFQFERTPLVEIELDTIQLGFIQLAIIFVCINSILLILNS